MSRTYIFVSRKNNSIFSFLFLCIFFYGFVLSESVFGSGLYDSNRHYLAGSPVQACKDDLSTGGTLQTDNYAGIAWVGSGYGCYCNSNPGAPNCVYVQPMCPSGFISSACHSDPGSPVIAGSGHSLICSLYAGCRRDGIDPSRNLGNESCPSVTSGNPINTITGNKYEQQQDISSVENSPAYRRYYNSQSENNYSSSGAKWSTTYSRSVVTELKDLLTVRNETTSSQGLIIYAQIVRPNGVNYTYSNEYSFILGNTSVDRWKNEPGTLGELVTVSDAGVPIALEYTDKNGVTERYNLSGKLISITYLSGYQEALTYDEQERLVLVSSNSGASLGLTYDTQNRIINIVDAGNRVWGYRYDESNNLEFVDNPDGTTRQYHYEDADYPNALTGITDERGVRYSTFSYDAQGRAILSTHAGDAQRVDIAYNDISGSRTVTNSSGEVSTYTSISQFGLGLVKGISGPGCSTCSNGNTSYDYDPATNDLLSKTENGVTTQYGNYDTKGQYGYKIEAVGTPEERRTDYTYDPRYYNKITTKTESSVATGNSKVTTYTYDDFGNRTSVTIDGFRPDGAAVSRTTTYQYNGPLHQLSQIDGPRTDVTDITTLDYYANDPVEGYNRGRLQRITGPAGIVLRDNIEYTATGKVLSEDRPNGVSLAYTYYAGNDRLETLTETAGGISRVTRWTYLATGEVETITQADGTALATTTRLVYDDARRLVGMIDQLGNHIDYTLDTEGNRIDEKVFDSANVLYKSVQQTFDIYNRLDTRTLVDEIIDYNFQPDGSLGDSINAKNVTTVFQYDALKRLTSTTGDVGGLDPDTQDTLTQYIYDAGDRLTSVTSPNNSNTTYSYDDLGNLLSEVSPDRGTRSYTYDEAGNVATITDARNITVSYSYDALNRVYSIDYPGTAEDVSLTYDTAMGCNNGIGKLCTVTDNSGTTTYSYDGFGNLAQQYKTELSVTYTTAYSYDALNRVEKLTLSDGRTVDYGYDALGRITSIDATVNGAQQTLAHNIQYRPDGLLTDIEFGNGFAETRLYNLKARLTTQTMPTGPANTAPSVLSTIPDQVGTESVAFNYTVPAGTFVDADAGDILTYSASLAGDAPLPAWLNFASASQTFSGTPASADVGTLSVQVTATDTGALTASTTFNLTINAAAANVITGADTNDYLTGSTAADNIYGLNGNDILNGGNGDDRLYGDDGDDSLNGGNDNDTLVGGAGNDSLNGGKGADTYRFSQGFGQDTLSDYDYTAGVVDRIVFDASITAADVNFTRIGNKLICSVGANGDSITSNNWFINAYYRIEEITFDDGSPMITADDVYRATLTFSGTAANDTLYGDYLADNMSALEG
ncbi:MAG TPA: hypothetical protein ENI97_05630, partial [Gammaproteobacteria bacterium]|nr:hypothetical protein [Gammaproteobacteria bacterium]